jgi:hypothetical protein
MRPCAPWLLLLIGLAALFGPALAAGVLLAPGEAIALYFPFRAIGFEAMRAGEWPFWNPFNFGGTPLLAAMQGGFFFPANWAFLVLPPVAAMNVAVVSTYAIAGIGTWALARACGLGRLGAAIAAIAFTASGFMLSHMEHLAIVQAAAMLPVMLWAIARRCETGRVRYDLAFALALALQLLAGHPQTLVLSLLVAVPFALWRGWNRTWPERLRSWLVLGAMGALGLGLGALQLLPTLDLIAESQRQAFPYELLVAESLPPRQLLSLWFPFLFGAPPSAMFPTPYWGAGPWFNERVGYVGVTTLGLAAIGLLGALRAPKGARGSGVPSGSLTRPTPGVRFWAVVAAIGLVLALGGTTPIYKLWAELPILKALRAPARHLLEVDLALAMLAGYGAQQLAGRLVARRQALMAWAVAGLPVLAVVLGVGLAGAAMAARMQPFMPAEVNLGAALRLQQPAIWLPLLLWVLLGLFLAVPKRGRAWQAALTLLVAADLWIFAQHQGWRQLSTVVPPTLGENLLARMSPERHLSLYRSAYPYYDPAMVKRVEPAGYAALLGQRSISGYDAFIKEHYAAIMGRMTHGGALSDPAIWSHTHHALDIYGVRRLHVEAAMLHEPTWRERLAAPRWRRVAEAPGPGVTLENTQALPRAWRVAQATLTPSTWVLKRMTQDGEFDPRREALVESPLRTAGLTAGPAEATTPGFNRLRVTTDGPGPGFVVVSETHDAGWKAFLGDRALAVHRVDGTLMGVEVPAGPQTVTLVYEPPRWRTGLAISGLSALLLAAWGLAARWRRRRAG